ncbi:hypothetical protein ACFLQT_01385, partial [Bacteroidota bacterium]
MKALGTLLKYEFTHDENGVLHYRRIAQTCDCWNEKIPQKIFIKYHKITKEEFQKMDGRDQNKFKYVVGELHCDERIISLLRICEGMQETYLRGSVKPVMKHIILLVFDLREKTLEIFITIPETNKKKIKRNFSD